MSVLEKKTTLERKIEKMSEKKIAVILIAIVIGITLSSLLYASINTHWNVFYQRKVESTYHNQGLPEEDFQSYLGRRNTFIPGYFSFGASTLKLTGMTPSVAGRTLIKLLSASFLVLSSIYFSKSLDLNKKQLVIFLIFLVGQSIVFTWIMSYPLHTLGLGMFLFTLGYGVRGEMDKRRTIFTGVMAGLSGLVHASYIVMFPLMYYVLLKHLGKSKQVVNSVKAFSVGALVTLSLYANVLIENGVPYAIQLTEWGYGIQGSFQSFIGYMAFLSPVLLIVFYKEIKEDWNPTLLWASIVLLGGYIFVSRRLDVFLGILISVMVAKDLSSIELPRLSIDSSKLFSLVILLGIGNGLVMGAHIGQTRSRGNTFLSGWYEDPFEFSGKTPGDRVISDPYYGHSLTYYTDKAVLSDLYVEYANETKYEDNMDFIDEEELGIMEKYGITTAVVDSDMDLDELNTTILFSNEHLSVHSNHEKFYSE